MKTIISNINDTTILLVIIIILLLKLTTKESFSNVIFYEHPYFKTLLDHKDKNLLFPYRLLYDENNKLLPIVALTSFFRSDFDKQRFTDYTNNGIKIIGITSYKTFPKNISDNSGDSITMNDAFDYTSKIKNWLSCFKNPEEYGFTSYNNLIEISESDFYDPEDAPVTEKKYDFIYSCLKDDDKCSLDGWNAINRNFNLFLQCLPIMIHEFKLKILIMGRINCGLEEKYGDSVTIMDMLPYHEFQQKLRESKFLFIPNIYDASPRVVSEAIIKDIPVLMNKGIVCGTKYINYETGELFTDQNDIRYHLKKLLEKYNKISPKKWWEKNYGKQKSGILFRNFLYKQYPDILENSKEIHFF